METGKWTSHVLINELPTDGVLLCTITDNVLDGEDWPIWAIVIKDGVVINHKRIMSGVYAVDTMMFWTKRQIAEWVQYEDSNTHPQIVNCIMRVA